MATMSAHAVGRMLRALLMSKAIFERMSVEDRAKYKVHSAEAACDMASEHLFRMAVVPIELGPEINETIAAQ